MFKDGGEVTELLWDKGNTVETVVLLSREKVNGYVDVDLDVEKIQGKSGSAT